MKLLALTLLIASALAQNSFNITLSTLQPEGIEYAPGVGFLVGSVNLGSVFVVNDTGSYTSFPKTTALINALGIQADTARGVFHAVNVNFTSIGKLFGGDFSGPFYSGLATFNLSNGVLIRNVDLSTTGLNFANDVAVDAAGNAYVTDSLAARIFKVTPQGNATIFATDNRWASTNIGLNGIDYHPNGFLLTASITTGKLYKVLVSTGVVTEVTLSGQINLTSADGLTLNGNGDLIVIKNGEFLAVLVRSTDNWLTASVIEAIRLSQDGVPTTVAVRGNDAYVVHTAFSLPFPSYYLVEKITFTSPPPPTVATTGAATTGASNATVATTGAATTGAVTNALPTTGAGSASSQDSSASLASLATLLTAATLLLAQ